MPLPFARFGPLCDKGRTGPPGAYQVGRLVRRPGGPLRQMLKFEKRLIPPLTGRTDKLSKHY